MSRDGYLRGLVNELCKLPAETTWVEFKHNNADPKAIGEYISALANSARLAAKTYGYMLWGIEDKTHVIAGTSFEPETARHKSQSLENWLRTLLNPQINFTFHSIQIEEMSVVVLEVDAAMGKPVRFAGTEYIRVGSHKKPLSKHPDLERKLWAAFQTTPWEMAVAKDNVSGSDVLKLIKYPEYFDLSDRALPEGREQILQALEREYIIQSNDAGSWDITNLGGMLFAKDLREFPTLERKAVRVIKYEGSSRVDTENSEQVGRLGYAVGFERLIAYVTGLVPQKEVMGTALRRKVQIFPEIAVRELIANALIHQDFDIRGTSPVIEIFDNWMEINNSGHPLVSTERFLDHPPRSRNEKTASLMRRLGICEERGSGIDKVVKATERHMLPPPAFESEENFTRSVLFGPSDLRDMDRKDKVKAIYFHASLRLVEREPMTNSSVRERFGLSDDQSRYATRLINYALDAGAIKLDEEGVSPRNRRYVPFWA